jgi:histidyl-tRNA synthetase
VLVAVPDDESRADCERLATTLRGRGIPTEVAPSAAKYGKQIRFAERRGIPFVWFPAGAAGDGDAGAAGDGGQVKDIRSGEQVDADPAKWTPPAEDLRPRILTE